MNDRLLPSPTSPLQLAVVIPVLNESRNVEELIRRIHAVLEGVVWEVIFVDDNSPDGTAEVARVAALTDPRVRIIKRVGRRGLSSAVIEGILGSSAPVLVVMDGDLQHDEAILPALFEAVASGANDVAVATRYAGDGSTGNWSASRKRISQLATALSRRLMKVEISDPMSGFFAVNRESLTAALPYLSTIGFKILMDLLASSPKPLRIAEFPYTFRERLHGQSKFDARAVQEFGILLLEKIFGRYLPVRFLLFATVGSLGLIVHLLILGGALDLGLGFRAAQSLAVWVAMTGNFALNNIITFRDLRLRGARLWRGLLTFYAVGAVGAIANVGVGAVVYKLDGVWWVAGIAGVAIGVVWNYAASSAVTWRAR